MSENNREALPTIRGFEYQKVKALRLLLANLTLQETWATIEHVEDVYFAQTAGGAKTEEYRQIKNSETENPSFSMNNDLVKKSLINFLETWIEFQKSRTIKFCLCLTGRLSKENLTEGLKTIGITQLPEEPLLEILRDKTDLKKQIGIFKNILVSYFSAERPKSKYLATITGLSDDEFLDFLNKVVIEDDSSKYENLVKECSGLLEKYSPLNGVSSDKVDRILTKLVGFVTLKMGKTEFLERLTCADHIKAQILEEIHGIAEVLDPAGLQDLDDTEDTRNLKDKIQAVCAAYKQKRLSLLNRKSVSAGLEATKLQTQGYKALRVRVYTKCEDILTKFIANNKNRAMTEAEVDSLFEQLKTEANQSLAELRKDYSYPISNQESIEGLIYHLFDSCFLAFDEV